MRASRASESTDQFLSSLECIASMALLRCLSDMAANQPFAEPRSCLRKPELRRQTSIHKENRSSTMTLYRAERFLPPKDPVRIGRRDFDFVQAAGVQDEAEIVEISGAPNVLMPNAPQTKVVSGRLLVMNHAIHFQF